ncbi:MAG: methyltransferase domain-containing protein [Chloroflexota bacterium]|nr:methyltransferase domain-containing protein [Chloroflexota bacterium]
MDERAIVAEAFSRTAERYDRFAEDHPHQSRMRAKVYAHLGRHVAAGARILELAAGTGTDAVELARRGYRVHATDIAPGMLARLRGKLGADAGERVSLQQCSFTELDRVAGAPYDAVFSDLGGLNCAPDLRAVVAQLPGVLAPGGTVTWVVMPPICLWELALLFLGQPRVALRRLRPGGTRAHLEGLHFTVRYHTPSAVVAMFGADYRVLEIEGLSVVTPTAESKRLATDHARFYRALAWIDDRLAHVPPWRGWGDFFIVSLRYEPRIAG